MEADKMSAKEPVAKFFQHPNRYADPAGIGFQNLIFFEIFFVCFHLRALASCFFSVSAVTG